MEIRYGDKTEVIDFIQDTSNLEYELARRVLKLTREKQPKLGLIQTSESNNYSVLPTLLGDQYQVVNISENSSGESWKDLAGVVVIDDGTGGEQATPSAELKNYLASNGGVMFFVDGVAVDTQSLTGTANASAFVDLLQEYGITLLPNLVYDLQQNEAITMGTAGTQFIVSYPFWIRPAIDQKNVPWAGVTSASLGWASSLTLNDIGGWQPKPMLLTSRASGTQTDTFNLSPNDLKKLPPSGNKSLIVGAVVEKAKQRIGAVADSQIASDEFLTNSQEDQTLVANLIDWAAADPILFNIPRRTAGRTVFRFASEDQVQTVQMANILIPPVVVTLLGFWWLRRRKKMTNRVYEIS
jgi:ABC-type uncharacterized transport system involved in gliding motility auxiliary subunit